MLAGTEAVMLLVALENQYLRQLLAVLAEKPVNLHIHRTCVASRTCCMARVSRFLPPEFCVCQPWSDAACAINK